MKRFLITVLLILLFTITATILILVVRRDQIYDSPQFQSKAIASSNEMPPASHSESKEGESRASESNRPDVPMLNPEDICTNRDSLVYKGYIISRYFDAQTDSSFATIKKNGRTLATFRQDEVALLSKDATRMGLFPLLGGKAKQLVMLQYSGGAHCCYSLWIYDLYPRFRLIFDSNKYPVGDYRDDFHFLDLNKDGVFEFTQDILTFADDFQGLPNVSSPRIPLLLKYDRNRGKYYPANHLFPAYALRWIDEEIRAIKEFNKDGATDDRYLVYMLDIVLSYIYAGREKTAWSFFDKEYKSAFLSKNKLRLDIKKLLRKDPVYRFIYNR